MFASIRPNEKSWRFTIDDKDLIAKQERRGYWTLAGASGMRGKSEILGPWRYGNEDLPLQQ
jgi:hypothetical protein